MARRTIKVEGLGHGDQPIPLAVRTGPLLVSGSISGRLPSGELPTEVAEEIEQSFRNVRRTLTIAGMELSDVAKIDVALRVPETRAILNDVWCRVFPDDDDRPARHITVSMLPGSLSIQLSVIAFDDSPNEAWQ